MSFARPQSIYHLHTDTDAHHRLCPKTNLDIILYTCTALSQPHPDPCVMTNIQKSVMWLGRGHSVPCAQLMTAADPQLRSGCCHPTALPIPLPNGTPSTWIFPSPSQNVEQDGQYLPPAHQLAVSHRPAPAASRPRWHAAGCHRRCTECTIPTVPPSAAATTCEFFPFPASGKSNRNLAQGNEERFFLSCATSCPYSCTHNPRTGSALPAQPASAARQVGKRRERLHVAIASNWQLTQPLAHTTLLGSKVLCKHQLINQPQPGGDCGYPGSRAAQAALARERVPGHPALRPAWSSSRLGSHYEKHRVPSMLLANPHLSALHEDSPSGRLQPPALVSWEHPLGSPLFVGKHPSAPGSGFGLGCVERQDVVGPHEG